MIIGFSKHGTGGAARPIQYLTAETVSAKPLDYLTGSSGKRGIRREPAPVVVRGDPARTKALIDSLGFKYKYSSGVLSFAPGEKISPEMEKSIIDQFERTAFAGLGPDQYDILWVRHRHTSGGRHELHFITPRVALDCGRSINIAPPRKSTRELFDTLRSKINAEFRLADPDDPARARSESSRTRQFKGNSKTESKAKLDVALRPNLQRARELDAKLENLVQSRSEYHQKRYSAPRAQDISENQKATLPVFSYDRLGTKPNGGTQTPGIELHQTGPNVCDHAGRFGEAAFRWRREHENVQQAVGRFLTTARTTTIHVEKEVTVCQEREATAALLSKYSIPIRPRIPLMELDADMDMEMPL